MLRATCQVRGLFEVRVQRLDDRRAGATYQVTENVASKLASGARRDRAESCYAETRVNSITSHRRDIKLGLETKYLLSFPVYGIRISDSGTHCRSNRPTTDLCGSDEDEGVGLMRTRMR
eukprot:3940413-Rhodomonas_salina.4